MKKNKKGFSLIEVVIAAGILSVTVFGVYKLIGENSKLINNSDNYMTLNNLFIPLQECIKNKGISSFSSNNAGDIIDFNFGSNSNLDGCATGTTDEVNINNILYELSGEIISNNGDNIEWKLKIKGEGVGSNEVDFLLY